MELLYLAVGMLIGVIIGLLLFSKKGKQDAKIEILNSELQKTESELSTEREKYTNSQSEISRLDTLNLNLQEKLNDQKKELEELQVKFTDAFKNLANEILEEKTKKFTEQNRANLDEILNPLKEKIKDFEQKVVHADEKNRLSNASLIEQIKGLKDLNKKISDDANNLTKALKGDSKIQGNWGEVILERILEESGLRKGIEYEAQAKGMGLKSEEGSTSKPDFVIKLPENKHVIVDSKVSLVHYERMVSSETEEQREGYLKALNTSVKTHIDGLHKKHYQDLKGLNSPDFVMMFIPIEGIFAVIMQHDNTVYQYAYNKQVVIVSPSTLLATLRTIAFIWRQENQTKNALEIARQGGALLDKFNGFIDDLEKIDVNLKRTQGAYDDAVNKLSTGSGNLISRAKRIEALGAKAKKQIPEKFINEETMIE
ncbi:MAG: DNA recombination protein RmuC [Candidatus Cloacimonadota bacterium]|nr:MAG: DNA recombination protein RmuC [Candidatus Cloacimonadota bacterium]